MRSERPAAPESGRRGGLVGFEQRVLARGRALACPPGTTVVVGFSGGADSLALAAALGRVCPRLGLVVRLAHVDHALRDISLQEQEQARGLAAALGLPFAGLRVAGDPQAIHPGVGLEEAARRERYRLLTSAVKGGKVAWDVAAKDASPSIRPSGLDLDADAAPALLALAHHEADQAETVLLHLLRGAGLAGAAGMAERAEQTVPWWEDSSAAPIRLTLWRPLLAEPRTVVRAYAAGLGLAWVEDPSNEDCSLRRNALRREALPILERISPGATAALARYGRTAADDDAALEALA
ncbi:MAG: tRNA lysidine(34) synthetase TilS, partial [Chloroflexota bacterium]|nr:tRNA lysidine(34) synthetase TilS [Chloroflexota bacterium]